jgi:hypothetical protein
MSVGIPPIVYKRNYTRSHITVVAAERHHDVRSMMAGMHRHTAARYLKGIVKLPSARFPNLPENEFAMMKLARRVGISVSPQCPRLNSRLVTGAC